MRLLSTTRGAASELALDLDSVKSDLRISTSHHDDILTCQYIPAAIAWAEGETNRPMVSKTCIDIFNDFPRWSHDWRDNYTIYLLGKVTTVASIIYVQNGSEVTLTGPDASPAGTGFQQDKGDNFTRLMPPRGGTWPDVDSDVINPVKITYTAGWANAEEVPADIRRAMTAHVYGAMELDGLLTIRPGFDMDHASKLISAYRNPWK